ncbi:MAG TPA: serine hydrolase domain-containing protein, partial [Anaeromyxobacter sp.]
MTPVLPAIERVLDEGRREGVAPALSAAVRRGGAVVHASWHGEIPTPSPRKLGKDDLFDVASLTKVMATATLAAQLAGEGALALDAPVAARLRGFEAGGKEGVSARHLLAHSSGLPGWRPYFEAA